MARVFHDWDNDPGLVLEGGGVLFGDGRVDAGVTKELALSGSAFRLDDIEVAFGFGTSGSRLSGQALVGPYARRSARTETAQITRSRE